MSDVYAEVDAILKAKASHVARAMAVLARERGYDPIALYAEAVPPWHGRMHQAHPEFPWRTLCHEWLQLNSNAMTTTRPKAQEMCGLCLRLSREARL